MSAAALRNWGLGLSAALMVGAIALALIYGDPQPVAPNAPIAARPLLKTEASPLAQPTMAQRPTAALPQSRLGFIVAFAEGHPMARAQGLAAQGRVAEAERAAQAALRSDPQLAGLCFDRFTLGGAETVLHVCSDAPAAIVRRDADAWRERFAAMSGVSYADVNAIAEPSEPTAP